MRAYEFITESATGSLGPGVANALPSTWVLPDLRNQDPYLQYRFGLALASARAKKAGDVPFSSASKFGENMVVTAYSPEDEETLMMALALYGEHNAKELISTRPSQEANDVYKQSPVAKINKKHKITY
jgi:hypothetical protein